MRLITTAASGIRAQQMALDTVADNLANINTTGFKERTPDFAETLATSQYSNDIPNTGRENAEDVNVGAGVINRSNNLNFTQGEIVKTEKPLDLAIEGEGFFQVETPDGQIAYTRNGNFHLDFIEQQGNKIGRLVNSQGNILKTQPELNITEDVKSVAVDSNGQIIIEDKNGNKQSVGRLRLSGFANPEKLNSIGESLYLPTESSGNANGLNPNGKIHDQSLELSNVNMAQEMSELIQAQRAYQLNVRMVQNGDKMWEIANSIRR